ncbi:ribonuclease E inhibitor RraB [Paenibacillus xylaniclasticus]|uniref:ribonuclease E inhibitor RraB n=1 Tax=Paenibacillus xylaniclasticus TaxID=588083 RepID=UPI001FEA6352|nr:ribonuclease E inhibitor RraB [Paenibacillus xylaniclasticus]
MMLFVLILLAGCGHDPTNDDTDADRKITLEQYYYSEYEERLRALQLQLQADGYKVSLPHSSEHNGVIEWSIYSMAEVMVRDIASEDEKAQNYAERFGVQYDGNGFPLE